MSRTILLAALAFAGCAAAPADAAARPGAIAHGGLNQNIRVGGLIVQPLAVTEDSRCPANVACVWAGRVVLRLRVSGMAGDQVISTIAPLRLRGGSALELVSVTPARMAGRPGTPAAYRFGFRRR